MELWKSIEGFESLYEVSNLGRVRNADGKILSQTIRGRGYLGVCLHNGGKQYQKSTHRLVAKAFIDNPNDLPCVNHIDEDKSNNRVDNLEWCSYRYNNSYGTRLSRIIKKNTGRKLSKETRIKMGNAHRGKNYGGNKVECIETGEIFPSGKAASLALGLWRGAVGEVCRGEIETVGGFHWRYL